MRPPNISSSMTHPREMGKFRPPEFWEKYDANILMLDLVRRKLSLEDRILEASSSFIKTTKRGELLAIEFLPHLAKFCQTIVEWYDEPKLSRLDRGQLRALFKVIKSVKKEVEGSKNAIINQNVQVRDPLAYYQYCCQAIGNCYAKFQANLEPQIRRAAQANTQPAAAATRNEPGGSRRIASRGTRRAGSDDIEFISSTVDLDQKRRAPPSESESDDSSESDDTPGPFGRTSRRTAVPVQQQEDKPEIQEICSSHGAPKPASDRWPTGTHARASTSKRESSNEVPVIVPSSRPIVAKREASQATEWEDFTRSSTPEAEEETSIPHQPDTKPRRNSLAPSSPKVKPEEEKLDSSDTLAEVQKSLLEAHQLEPSVLGDLWITHRVVKSCKITNRSKELSFQLAQVDHLTYPRFPPSLPATEDEDEQKLLPKELVMMVEYQLNGDSPAPGNPREDLKFTLNHHELLVHTHSLLEPSLVKLIIPVHPQYLKVRGNMIRIRRKNETGTTRWTLNGRLSIEVMTMLSEREIFEKAIRFTCANHRIHQIHASSTILRSLDTLRIDPITSPNLIQCPVRGSQCQHIQCFDLKNFIDRNRFKSDWTCPLDSCETKCKPVDLEFDYWLFEHLRA